jgi:hypothetical protein
LSAGVCASTPAGATLMSASAAIASPMLTLEREGNVFD